MASKKILVIVVLLSVILGVDARSPRKTEKLYRKAGKWQRKLRDVWALLGVKPFLVQPGEEGDECVLKSKITVDDAADKGDYMLKSTVEAEYVLKGADVFTQGDVDAAVAAAKDGLFTQAQLDAAVAAATADLITEEQCPSTEANLDAIVVNARACIELRVMGNCDSSDELVASLMSGPCSGSCGVLDLR